MTKTNKKVDKVLGKAQLLKKLERLAKSDDTESAHCEADGLLIEYIDDKEIADAYSRISKWYA